MLSAGKAAVKQRFDRIADFIDKQDSVFRGEEPIFLKTKQKLDKFANKAVTIQAVKGIQQHEFQGWDIDRELKIDERFDQQVEDQEMAEEDSLPTIIGAEQKKLYQELDELADLVPEINDIQYTLKNQQLNSEQLKEHIYNLEYKANHFQEILDN